MGMQGAISCGAFRAPADGKDESAEPGSSMAEDKRIVNLTPDHRLLALQVGPPFLPLRAHLLTASKSAHPSLALDLVGLKHLHPAFACPCNAC